VFLQPGRAAFKKLSNCFAGYLVAQVVRQSRRAPERDLPGIAVGLIPKTAVVVELPHQDSDDQVFE
jgi:hypothetical protein